MVALAAFDFDGTLTVRDCVLPFMRHVSGRGFVTKTVLRRAPEITRAITRNDRDRAKRMVVEECFKGKEADVVSELGIRFAERISKSWLRSDTLARLRWHQSEGHHVVLVSASLDPYIVPLGEMLGVDAVLCTTLEVIDGVHTGRLVGDNCRGDEKVRRLEYWAHEAGLHGDRWLTHAYGDSSGDDAMLAAANLGVHVKKKEISVSC